jgi:ferredoxin-NADP reductase/ferredoxin
VSSFRLAPGDGDPAPHAVAGQYLTVRLPTDPPLVRSYSLSDEPDDRGYRISVKREGAGSRYLHEHVQAGDVLDVAAPRGAFVLRDGSRPAVLISAGVGATPVLAMLHALVRERVTRPVWWLHGARNLAEHPFREEAEALLAALPDTHRLIAYSRPEPGDAADVAGRLDRAALDRAGVPVDAEYYVCGPAGFMTAIEEALTARGVAPGDVATETFGAVAVHASGIVSAGARDPHVPDGEAGTGPAVTFVRSALTVPWDDRFPSLLDFAEACDVPVGFGCRTGVCHNCESGLLTGEVDYFIDPLEPPADGRTLMCCTRPGSALTLDL